MENKWQRKKEKDCPVDKAVNDNGDDRDDDDEDKEDGDGNDDNDNDDGDDDNGMATMGTWWDNRLMGMQ